MDKKPYTVGIAGGTCSGKTTAAERLCALFENRAVTVINMDKYFRRISPTVIAPVTRIEYVEHNHPDSLELEKMYADFEAACESEADLVIIEGLFALYLDRIREKLDFKIFVDLKSDERLVRRISKWTNRGQSFEEVTARYLDTVRYRHDELIEPTRWHADIVINGTLDAHGGLGVVCSHIENVLNNL